MFLKAPMFVKWPLILSSLLYFAFSIFFMLIIQNCYNIFLNSIQFNSAIITCSSRSVGGFSQPFTTLNQAERWKINSKRTLSSKSTLAFHNVNSIEIINFYAIKNSRISLNSFINLSSSLSHWIFFTWQWNRVRLGKLLGLSSTY